LAQGGGIAPGYQYLYLGPNVITDHGGPAIPAKLDQLLPVLFLFAAAAVVGRRDGPLAALRGGRAVLLAALVALAGVVLWPGLDELALWRALVGLPPL